MPLPPPDRDSLVLITGASSGTGEALARNLAARGYGLAIVGRRADRLSALADQLRAAHEVRVDVRVHDLADPRSRRSLIEDVARDGRFISGLCNDAGLGAFGRFQRLPYEREQEQVRVNVDALHHLTGAFVREMVARGAGAILNIGSLAGYQPLPNSVTYGATKAFVNSFSEGLHADLAGTGVSCSVICPGPVGTEFFRAAGVERWAWAGPRFLWASPAEMAEAGVSAMLTGRRVVQPRRSWAAAAVGGRVLPRPMLLPVVRGITDRWLAAES